MNILNMMKRTSVVLGLLLIPTIINSSYQYVKKKKKKQSSSDNTKQKNDRKASKAEIEAVKNMYKEFQEIINSKLLKYKRIAL